MHKTGMTRAAGLLLLGLASIHCGPGAQGTAPTSASAPGGMVREGTPPEVDIVKARAKNLPQGFDWQPYEPATFERAAREKKLILLDGAAAWCHWCHVMDETTYRDPEVGRVLKDQYIAIRVDIDEHPDMAERYGEWGWPATILLSADGQELGKFRGYLPPNEMLDALKTAAAGAKPKDTTKYTTGSNHSASPAELPWAIAFAAHTLDDYYDDELGGWGQRQKAPVGEALEVEARRALAGDERAKKRVIQTIDAQRGVLDPVWGGVYQYSEGGSWKKPHFEKLMTFQAANLSAYAVAHRATQDKLALDGARAIKSYMATFLSGKEGGFFVSQDADVGSHDEKVAFIDGHVFYEKSDAERRALGMPHVDDNVYAYENGLAIVAFVAHHEATKDQDALARARRAADLVLSGHVNADGTVLHAADPDHKRTVRHLADAASFGFGLASLARVTGEAKYRDAAVRIAAAMDKDFAAESGGLYASTVDPGAVGVFAERRKPFDSNVLAARFFNMLAKVTTDERYRTRSIAVLGAVATPTELEGQGRMIGGFLLAADDLGMLQPVLAR